MPLSIDSELSEVQQIVRLHHLKRSHCADCMLANILINTLPDEAFARNIEVCYLITPIAKAMGQCATGYISGEGFNASMARCTNPVFDKNQADPVTEAMKSILDEANAAQNGEKGQE